VKRLETKICSKCGKELELTKEYFNKQIRNKDGFKNKCRDCCKKIHQQYYKDNKTGILEKSKQYGIDNKATRSNHHKQYVKDNAEHFREYIKKWQAENHDKVLEAGRRHNEKHKAEVIEYRKRYRETHREALIEWFKQYNLDNREIKTISTQRYRARKLLLPSTLTSKQWETIKQHFNNKCAYCGKELPLSQDHFIAIKSSGEYGLNNIVASCRSCNSSKGSKDFFGWYPKYKYYSKKREKQILEFLNYKNGIQQLALTF
jgi:5-methylcytosine-specific restriction endonuclease McrA